MAGYRPKMMPRATEMAKAPTVMALPGIITNPKDSLVTTMAPM